MKSPLLVLTTLLAMTACSGSINDKDFDTDPEDTGETGDPRLNISESAVDFGDVGYGDTASVTVNFINTGGAQIDITGWVLDAPFIASTGAGITIAAGNTLPVTLSYVPDDYTPDSTELVITSNDPVNPEVTISLTGGVITDADGDGYASEAAGGDDCDDDDAETNPDADDEWYDGEDTNCDDADDYDQDGDGYQAMGYNDDPDDGGGDCQDANADMFPGAVDVWYDGEDTDCDGADDYDQDGDGTGAAAYGRGSDCDDTNPDVNRDGDEIFNGLDDDCDDEADNDVLGSSSHVMYTGSSQNDYAGYSVALADLDNDGYAEVLAGVPNYSSGRGGIAVESGYASMADGAEITSGDNLIIGDGGTDALGTSIAVSALWDSSLSVTADFDGDSEPDVAIGAPNAETYGMVYVLSGDDALSGDVDDAYTTISGDSSYGSSVGQSIAQAFDMDGDGYTDLAGFYDGSYNGAWLIYGGTQAAYTLGSVDVLLQAETAAGEESGWDFPLPGDLDGDGYDELIFCDKFADINNTNDGATWVLWGSSTQYDSSGEQGWASYGDILSSGSKFEKQGEACSVGPDLDGDGSGEFWILNRADEAMYVVSGGSWITGGDFDPAEYATITYTWGDSDPSPSSFRVIGDYDGDGIGEMAIGLESGSGYGDVWIYSSQDEGELDGEKDALALIEGEGDDFQNEYGWAIDGGGDFNGDGTLDFVAGDWGYGDPDASEDLMGAIYISYNGQ